MSRQTSNGIRRGPTWIASSASGQYASMASDSVSTRGDSFSSSSIDSPGVDSILWFLRFLTSYKTRNVVIVTFHGWIDTPDIVAALRLLGQDEAHLAHGHLFDVVGRRAGARGLSFR